jgi:8-oxo-dGTP diphosphatase
MSTSLFTTRRWAGEPAESSEIIPEWFLVSALPLERMWQDAEHWLPLALAGRVVDAVITLNEDNETVATAEYSFRTV